MPESPLRPPATGQHSATDQARDQARDQAKAPAADRRLLLALAVGGVALLGVTGFVVLPALSPAASVSGGPVAPAAVRAGAAIGSRSASPAADVLSPAFTGAAGRDPFVALVSPPAATASPTPTATASPAAVVPAGTATPGVPAVSSASSAPTPATAIGTPTGTPVTLLLTKVDGQSGAEVSFAGTPLHLVDGQLFHTVFRLLGAQTSSAVFQYGNVIFTLVPGQSRTFLL